MLLPAAAIYSINTKHIIFSIYNIQHNDRQLYGLSLKNFCLFLKLKKLSNCYQDFKLQGKMRSL